VIIALGVRTRLMPEPGLAGDLDQFIVWARGVAVGPIGQAYDMDIAFPPVMVYIWQALAWLDPRLATAATADAGIHVLMKTPAVLADLVIATAILWVPRMPRRWAVLGAALILFHPAAIDVSALWGQYESIFVAFAVVAAVLAMRGHTLWAAVALAFAATTKPQALPLLIPFAAWFLARDGWRRTAVAAAIGAVTVTILWLPFIPAGGIGNYLGNLADYQGGIYAILSLRAWNAWWLVQEALGGGSFLGDQAAILGPITLRHVGYALALAGEAAVFVLVYRARTPRALVYGLAASALVASCLLTTMHERYAFAALAFLPLALPDRRALVLSVVFGVVFTVNLLAAVPPTPAIGAALPVAGPLGIVGSVAMLGILAAILVILRREVAIEQAARARAPMLVGAVGSAS
jgi:hypothetical protein